MKDCVFWVKLPVSDPEGKRFIVQWQSDIAAGLFPGAYANFKSMPLSRQETVEEIRAVNATRPKEHRIILDPFLNDDEKVVVKLVCNHWDARYPVFAYSHLEIDNGYVRLSDGCRLHLNIDYQLKVTAYLRQTVLNIYTDGDPRVMILGDGVNRPWDKPISNDTKSSSTVSSIAPQAIATTASSTDTITPIATIAPAWAWAISAPTDTSASSSTSSTVSSVSSSLDWPVNVEVCCKCQNHSLEPVVQMGPYWGTNIMCKACFEKYNSLSANGTVECVCKKMITVDQRINKGNTWFCFDCNRKY